MKCAITIALFLLFAGMTTPKEVTLSDTPAADTTTKIFIITLDGFRWQELFKGADDSIVANPAYTSDPETVGMLYGGSSTEEKRKKLMPFLWSIACKKGMLFGNRDYDNDVNTSNIYRTSYPGYNEMFTGTTDLTISNNNKNYNSNTNIFEYLNSKDAYKGRIALFSSWDVFPFILNEKRTGIEVNSGYEEVKDPQTNGQQLLNTVQSEVIAVKEKTRQDLLTYVAAREYLQQHKPRILYLGLGETDEYAHQKNYAMYLQKANEADKIISELWHWAQTTEGYKNNTVFILTTDHGRGAAPDRWMSHNTFIKGSSQTWMAVFGKGINPGGEIKIAGQIFQKQLAQTIARLLGENFGRQNNVEVAVASK
jgi:hypothetical protein